MISSLFSWINCSNEATKPCALSFAASEKAASSTTSLLTVSMVCSNRCFITVNWSRNAGLVTSGATTSFISHWAANVTCSGVGSTPSGNPASVRAASLCRSGSSEAMMFAAIVRSGIPPADFSRACCSGLPSLRLSRTKRPAREERISESILPKATACRSLSKAIVGCRSKGRESVSSCSQTPTHRVLLFASDVTDWKSGSLMTRTPRPFICSKKLRLLTARMNITTSSGLMSVPVAIMSTVTTMRGL